MSSTNMYFHENLDIKLHKYSYSPSAVNQEEPKIASSGRNVNKVMVRIIDRLVNFPSP